MNYIVYRLRKNADMETEDTINRNGLKDLANWLENVFTCLSKIPRYLIPSYFDLLITSLYSKALERCWSLMNNKHLQIANASSFVKKLSLTSLILCGRFKSAMLPNTIITKSTLLSMSAGLPHFAQTIFRNWGRDTFISLRGLLLLTNRFDDAADLILSYGSCLRHGLIPNLLGEGKCSRFNCRDSVWWWLKAIKDYTELAPNGMDLLQREIIRLYPNDDSEHPSDEDLKQKSDKLVKQKLCDVIQEALSRHVNGLKFRERNAGPNIDNHMTSNGFNIEIGVDLKTGFVYGGNAWNCGTWMDKLGSSHEGNNYGKPATPRDGSAIELVGLCRCVLEWLKKANETNKYPYDGVELYPYDGIKYTWTQWAQRIDESFENHFWIDENSTESPHINKRNIYKVIIKL
jgi:glycogen debranching enzyme